MKKFLLMLAFIVSVLLSGCTIDNHNEILLPPYYPGYVAHQNSIGQYAIGGYVNGQAGSMTRAAIASNTYEKFSLYAWTKDSTVMDGYHGVFSGNIWSYTEDLKYFDNKVDEYKFIAAIASPSSTMSFDRTREILEVNGLESFSTDDPRAQDGTQTGIYADDQEFLYASAQILKSGYAFGVPLEFKHGNAKVYVKFVSDDPETEILDFKPSISYHSYSMIGKPFPVQGPALSSGAISDEDIEYVNSRYASSLGWVGYYSSNTTIEGDLKSSMWEYLETKNPSLSSMSLNNWANYVGTGHEAMRLVHIDKNGADNSYRGWFINTINVQLIDNGTVSTGINGVIVIPATSVKGDGTDAMVSSFPTKVNATVRLSGTASYTEVDNRSSFTFTKPEGTLSTNTVASPTTLYTFASSASSVQNVGFTIKFSCKFNGVEIYDNRVYVKADQAIWEEGKYYTYIVHLHGKGNGFTNPEDADENDPKIPVNQPIMVNPIVKDYAFGRTFTFDLY